MQWMTPGGGENISHNHATVRYVMGLNSFPIVCRMVTAALTMTNTRVVTAGVFIGSRCWRSSNEEVQPPHFQMPKCRLQLDRPFGHLFLGQHRWWWVAIVVNPSGTRGHCCCFVVHGTWECSLLFTTTAALFHVLRPLERRQVPDRDVGCR